MISNDVFKTPIKYMDELLKEIYNEHLGMVGEGHVADYIPELAAIDPNQYAIAVTTIDGQEYMIGDYETRFTIQSISKVFTLALLMKQMGEDIWHFVGREPSGTTFNSLIQIEQEKGLPRNPFINAGALVITERIMEIITAGFEKRGWKRPMVLIEPGRYVVGNAGITLYTVGSIKDIPGIRKYVSVDGGMSDNIRTALYGAEYEAVIADRAESKPEETVCISGKNCESGDILIHEIRLPKIHSGDILAMFSTGAYHYTMSSNYNQLPKPAIVFTYQGKTKQVVRRQSFDDLVACDVEEQYEDVAQPDLKK